MRENGSWIPASLYTSRFISRIKALNVKTQLKKSQGNRIVSQCWMGKPFLSIQPKPEDTTEIYELAIKLFLICCHKQS